MITIETADELIEIVENFDGMGLIVTDYDLLDESIKRWFKQEEEWQQKEDKCENDS